jgi:pimeloyl-ACP methyl ester carboxylesterase
VSAIYLDNRLVHYEVFGRRGAPIIFLHSWMGSWRYWVPVMDVISEHYRAYALDFWGFGESDHGRHTFTIADYEQMLIAFMDDMGIRKANLVGHGLGGMVAVGAASHSPERFLRIVTVSTPLDGSIISESAKPATLSRLLGRSKPANIWSKLLSGIPVENDEVNKELKEDTDNLSEEVVQIVYESIVSTDVTSILKTLEDIPLLAIYGEKDTLVPPGHATVLDNENGLPQQRIVLPKTSHFPFLENTSTFSRLLLDFLVSEGTPVEIKEQWRRRVSQREYF